MRAVTETESRLFSCTFLVFELDGLDGVAAGQTDNFPTCRLSAPPIACASADCSMYELLRCAMLELADNLRDSGNTGGLPSRVDFSARAAILADIPEDTFDLRMRGAESVVLTEEIDDVLFGRPNCDSDEGTSNSGVNCRFSRVSPTEGTRGTDSVSAMVTELDDLADRELGRLGGKKGLAGDFDIATGVACSKVAVCNSSMKSSSARNLCSEV